MTETDHDQGPASRHALNKKVEAAGWGLFFIWIGVALLADVGWGVGLIGVGIIILGAQVSRAYLALNVEGFWVVVGFLFVVGGIWELFNVQLALVPLLCIVAGVALLASALRGGPRD